jgi:hypothetical protein
VTIDIMMPFYGRVDQFKEAVLSVVAQSDPDWRLVVIDDCYPDLSAGQWLVNLGDERIEYRRNEVNLGINLNFQACIDLATNEWVTIFGCDDVMLPDYVRTVARLGAEHPRATFIQPGVQVIDGDGNPTSTLVDWTKARYRPATRGTFELTAEELAVSITRGNWMYFPSLCWRRDAIAKFGFRPDLSTVQDLALAIDLVFDGATLVVDDVPVFLYRRHAASVSSWRAVEGSRFAEEGAFFDRIAGEYRARGWKRAHRAALNRFSSRLNAASRLPAAAKARNAGAVSTLLRYAFLPGRTRVLPRDESGRGK